MNKDIVIGFLKEHDTLCQHLSISTHIREKRPCTFCSDLNRDISLLLTSIKDARRTLDIGLALHPSTNIDGYLPYQTAGLKLFFQEGQSETERILNIFRKAFEQGYSRVVALSHSVPNLPLDFLETALTRLRSGKSLVLGPLENGMFYLIGATKRVFGSLKRAGAFEHLCFLNSLFRETVLRLVRKYYPRCAVLPEWYSLKSLDDLKKVHRDSSQGKGWKTHWVSHTIADLHRFISS